MHNEDRPDDNQETAGSERRRPRRRLVHLGLRLRRPIVGVPVLLALTAVLALFALGAPPFSVPPPEEQRVSVTVKEQIEPAAATEQFLQGQKEFNAAMVWDTLDESLHQQMITRGLTRQAYQEQLDQARDTGGRIAEVYYIGGMKLQDGRAVYVYVVNLEAPDGSAQVPYTFVVNPQGKIEGVQ